MVDKCDPEMILFHAASYYFFQDNFRDPNKMAVSGDIPVHEYQIRILLGKDLKQALIISAPKDQPAILSTFNWENPSIQIIPNKEIESVRTFINKIAVYKEGTFLEEFPDLDSFWSKYGRGD